MSSRNVVLSLILAAACCAGATMNVHAGEEGAPPKHKGGGRGGGGLHFVLNHAADLKLTDEQKTKLQALADAPKDAKSGEDTGMKDKVEAILTDDQKATLKTLMASAHKGGKDAGKDAAPAPAPGDTKPGDDKK